MPEILSKKALNNTSAKEENVLDWKNILDKFKLSCCNSEDIELSSSLSLGIFSCFSSNFTFILATKTV